MKEVTGCRSHSAAFHPSQELEHSIFRPIGANGAPVRMKLGTPMSLFAPYNLPHLFVWRARGAVFVVFSPRPRFTNHPQER
jgi:hypothetical protein